MSMIAQKAVKGGGYDLRKDKELVIYLLENAEIEHEFVGNDTIETSNGIIFEFGENEELVGLLKDV